MVTRARSSITLKQRRLSFANKLILMSAIHMEANLSYPRNMITWKQNQCQCPGHVNIEEGDEPKPESQLQEIKHENGEQNTLEPIVEHDNEEPEPPITEHNIKSDNENEPEEPVPAKSEGLQCSTRIQKPPGEWWIVRKPKPPVPDSDFEEEDDDEMEGANVVQSHIKEYQTD